jgi:putative DNA primase/helicase
VPQRLMMALDAALALGARDWRVFPCIPCGPRRKNPLTRNGFHDASTNLVVIAGWWQRWPDALIGIATGAASGFVVLDVDVKYSNRYGFDTLDALGFGVLPETPMAHTTSGGLHIYFALATGVEIGCTEGDKGRGVGRGLDWRGTGGYVIAPSPGSGYCWDPYWNFDTIPLAKVPPALVPREVDRPSASMPVKPDLGLSRYAETALDTACRQIIAAPPGQQETTLNAECFALGTLAGAGAIPSDFARRVLIWAAHQMPDHDPCRPWRDREVENKVNRAFSDGMRHPREARRAG